MLTEPGALQMYIVDANHASYLLWKEGLRPQAVTPSSYRTPMLRDATATRAKEKVLC